MTGLAIYVRLVMYPLLALGLFMLATCCYQDRLQKIIYLCFALMSLFQFAKAVQLTAVPGALQPVLEWGWVLLIAVSIVVVWLEFFRQRKKM